MKNSNSFIPQMRSYQVEWKKRHLPQIQEMGLQNKQARQWILPRKDYRLNFYPDIITPLFDAKTGYLKLNKVKPHTGIHNLTSSWVLCANMYWPFHNPEGYRLFASFLERITGFEIDHISDMDLEYEDESPALRPGSLLGEGNSAGGMRGSGQTSPDLAVRFVTRTGNEGIILVESKFTEHSFYSCSGYNKPSGGKSLNPDKNRCLDPGLITGSSFSECHLVSWNRHYWDLLGPGLNRKLYNSLKKCPMSNSCYQLFRQQALAKGLEKKYSVVVSAVAADERNLTLRNSSVLNGMKPFPEGWQELFPETDFRWFSHQDWYRFVEKNDKAGRWSKWLAYTGERYGY